MKRRCLVVSAVNLVEGGPLTVLRNFIDSACAVLPPEWDIVVFVNNTALITAARARTIAIPYAKRNWLLRLWVEWFEFKDRAAQLSPDLWVSLHDMSPNVGRVRQAVYCHNATPFFATRVRDVLFQPKQFFFRVAYAFLYRIRLNRNCAVIVQQSWMRDAFRKWLRGNTDIIVAHPVERMAGDAPTIRWHRTAEPATFIYPTLARPFKNLELVCRAVETLERGSSWRGRVVLTVDATENRYGHWLKKRFGQLKTVQFVGRQTRAQMQQWYVEADCLLFTSRMESWGLPMTEAKQRGLPMFVSDFPFARETVGDYDAADFVDPADHLGLAAKMLAFQQGTFEFQPARFAAPAQPFAPDWESLLQQLMRYAD